MLFFTFYHGKSPLNHHLGNVFILFPTTLSKSKILVSLLNLFPWRKKNKPPKFIVQEIDSEIVCTSPCLSFTIPGEILILGTGSRLGALWSAWVDRYLQHSVAIYKKETQLMHWQIVEE